LPAQVSATIFCAAPTLYAALLASAELPKRDEVNLRICTAAAEALPEDIGRRWLRHFGVDVLDGIGSTEMLHIFISNRPGDVVYGTTGRPVPDMRCALSMMTAVPCRAARPASCKSRTQCGDHVLEQPRALARDVSGAVT